MSCIVKYEYADGMKLTNPTSWCGKSLAAMEWKFQDAQHAILSVEQNSLVVPCSKCMENIAKVVDGFVEKVKNS